MAYLDQVSELKVHYPHLPFLQSKKFITRSWADVCQRRRWGFLFQSGYWVSPAVVTTGTVSITRFGNEVTLDATAKTAWDGISTNETDVAPINRRQFRPSLTAGHVYSILEYDSANSKAYLDRPISEATNTASAYQMFKAYYQAPLPSTDFATTTTNPGFSLVPDPDFMRLDSVLDVDGGYPLLGVGKPLWTRAELDRADRQRASQGNPYRVALYKVDTQGLPVYELWPHSLEHRVFPASYELKRTAYGTSATPLTDALPVGFPDEIVMERALWYGAMWAQKNVGRYPEYRSVNWSFIGAEHRKNYESELVHVERRDEESSLSSYMPSSRNSNAATPIDSNFAQSHIIDWAI